MKIVALLVALLALIGAANAMTWNYEELMSYSDATGVSAGSTLNDQWKLEDTPHTVEVGGEDIFHVADFELNPSFAVPTLVWNDYATTGLPDLDYNQVGTVVVAGAETGKLTASIEDIEVAAPNGQTVTRRLGTAEMDSDYQSVWSAAGDALNDIHYVAPDFSSDIKVQFEDGFLGADLVAEEVNTIAGHSSITKGDIDDLSGGAESAWNNVAIAVPGTTDKIDKQLKDAGDLKGGMFDASSSAWVEATSEAGELKSVFGGSGVAAQIYSWAEFNTDCPKILENEITTMQQQLKLWEYTDLGDW